MMVREFTRFVVLPTGVDPAGAVDAPEYPTQDEAWAFAHGTAQESEKPHRVYGVDANGVTLVGETFWHIVDFA